MLTIVPLPTAYKPNLIRINEVFSSNENPSHSKNSSQNHQDVKMLKVVESFKKEMIELNLNYQASMSKKDKVKKYLETLNNSKF